MRNWHIQYELCTNFSTNVKNHTFVLRSFPYRQACKDVRNLECRVVPEAHQQWSTDSFGNTMLTGRFLNECALFKVTVDFDVDIGYSMGVEEQRPDYAIGMFKCQSEYTRPGDNLKEFLTGLDFKTERSQVDLACYLMFELYKHFTYVTGSTSVRYDAEQAFAQNCGVCQDFAHILLSLCRARGLLVRYVAGAIPGEGQSHAWVEVLDQQQDRWFGIDPTHNRICDDTYVPFAVGRDAQDCALNRGVFLGMAQQQQYISLVMNENEGGAN